MKLGDVIIKEDGSGRRRKHIVVQCDNCGNPFPKPKRFVGKGKREICSRDCLDAANQNRIKMNCAICGKEVWRNPSKVGKNNLAFCCREHKEEAQTIKSGLLKCTHYADGSTIYRRTALEHYGAKCEWCGFGIEALLEAHHINKNRYDNRIENLIILCLICHGLVHKDLVEVKNREAIILSTENKEKISQIFKGV